MGRGLARRWCRAARTPRHDDLRLEWVYLRLDRAPSPVTLLLPGGAPRLILVAVGVADESVVESARLVPLALVPKSQRDSLRFPAEPDYAHYRVGDDRLRVTAADRSEPESGGFRLDGEWGHFLLEAPAGAPLTVRVCRTRPMAGDTLWWNRQAVPLPAARDVTLTRVNAGGVSLGTVDVLPVWLQAEGAWIAFHPPDTGQPSRTHAAPDDCESSHLHAAGQASA